MKCDTRKRLLAILAAVVFFFVGSIAGTVPPIAADSPSLTAGQTNSTAAAPKTDNGLVAVPEPSPRAMAYYRSGNVLWILSQGLAMGIPFLVLFTGLSARIRVLARRVGRRWYFVVLAYFVFYSLLEYVLCFPLAFYAGFIRQHAYGLSNQSVPKWLVDSLKELAIGLVFGGLLVGLPYLLIRRSPRRWWLYTALLSLPVMFFVMLVEPIWVAPLFNHFGPMKDKPLETQILALAQEAGIEGSRVFEVDKSVDTNAVNAYVTGFLNTKRIVLWDTLLAKLNVREIRVVMAHEIGHYVLNHVVLGILAGFAGVLAGLYLVHRFSVVLLRRCKRRFGFEELSDVASLPLILLLVQVFSFAAMPVGLAVSRHFEHEADRFALELTKDNHAAATAFVRLQQTNLSNPRPGLLFTLWRASHPSLGERIEFANTYRPWEHGEPLRYGNRFRASGMRP